MRDSLYIISNLLLLLIFIGCYLSMPHLDNRQNRFFLALLVSQSALFLMGIVSGWVPAPLSFVLRLAYFALFPVVAYSYGTFNAQILHLEPDKVQRRVYWAAFAAAEIVTLAGAVGTVRTGIFPALCLIAQAVLSIWLLRKFSARLNHYEYVSAMGSQFLLFAGGVLYFFLPSDFIVTSSFLAATVVFYLAFENPNLYVANRGGAFNMRAFRNVMDERIAKKSYRLLAFALQDYIDMRGIYGGAQMDSGVSMIGRFLVLTYPEYQAFYLRSGRFVLLGSEHMDFEQVRTELHERFQSPWVADGAELDLGIAFVQVEPETGLDSVDRILNYLFLAFDKVEETLSQPDGLIEPESIQEMDRQVEIKRSLDRCLENNEVEIFLQPLIDSKSRNLAGAEVLSRIRDDRGQLISPAVFVPVAEKNGCINLMGEQVLEKACQFVRDHDLEQIGLSWLNVNLSPIQCMRKDLSKRFSIILEQYGISTEIIHLEITEQSVMDISRLEEQIQILRGIGFRFSLDDYGSGYSNLSRVKQYPFANIKLDMGIVWDYIRDRDVLLPTIVRAFKEMGFSVTAEGIENAEMADAMSALGCDYLQGYYFSKPLPTEEFVRKYVMLKQNA